VARIDPLTAHMNARVRGMKAELLTHQQLDALLDQGDVDQMAQTLLDSAYKTEMAEALAGASGADAVELGVSRNLVATYRKLLRAAQGHLRGPAQLFLTRWDLMAVKALLRNRHHGLDAETGKESLMPGPSLTVALMNDFASRPTMDELISALASWNASLCGVLAAHANEYHNEGGLQILEDALDYQYFVKNARKTRNARTVSGRMLHRVLRMEIDRINLRMLLQHRQTSGEADFDTAHLMPMGFLTGPTLEAMVSARDAADAMEHLGGTRYAELAERLAGFVQTNRYAPIDRMMELLMIQSLGRASRETVMSIAILMQFAWLKYNEVVNLRMIARGEARHLPAGRVREELVYA
jgi:vacuolar-type H+-ATPase subunit C/Vma6